LELLVLRGLIGLTGLVGSTGIVALAASLTESNAVLAELSASGVVELAFTLS
jgi:hypothetical protein